MPSVLRWYRQPGLSTGACESIKEKLKHICKNISVSKIETELCFYIELDQNNADFNSNEEKKLLWIISVPFEEESISRESALKVESSCSFLIEIGPRLNFSTAFSTNAVSMCQSIGLSSVKRIEYATRYLISTTVDSTGQGNGIGISNDMKSLIESCLYDKMTQCVYRNPIKTFDLDVKAEPVFEVNVMGEGRPALERANKELGLAFDDWDLDYYTKLFKEKVQRNPTSVECFDLAQSNSEHSRHWYFKGRMVVDGKEVPDSLFKMVMSTQDTSNQNNVIKFNDNSSAIEGFKIKTLLPQSVSKPSEFSERNVKRHIIFTAETHNFPTGVAPFPGATTGTGGRIRDVQATGRGAHVIAGTAGYSFGNLNLPDYPQPWEDKMFEYPPNFASPRQIAIEASNGASDYGNKFGEPVLAGFARSFGMKTAGVRREWVKPIMFSGGLGSMESIHVTKDLAEKGMSVVKLGGPIYRIGVGGGAASSIQVQGDNKTQLDFGAVQRGDAEMEQKLNRVIRACVESGEDNPIRSIHDQGAGGNGNVLKEISEPAGAEIWVGSFQLGDPTLSVLEVWGAEYQESNAALIRDEDKFMLSTICEREKCPVSFVGDITGDGRIKLIDDLHTSTEPEKKRQKLDQRHPVDLDLELVLGKMPSKVFNLDHEAPSLEPLRLPESLAVRHALERVLRLPAVASKRYLTNKVDRSVTGLVAQQQCVGPLHTPLADVAVVALSHFTTHGSATAIGEQPIKGLIDAGAGARLSVAEALTNLVFASITDLKDVKCSGNWMWAAKLAGEGALLVDACAAMCRVMRELGVAVDGGKDSLSMAARVGGETVKAPGTLVVSTYVGCPDVRATITPDLKCPNGKGVLLYIPMSNLNPTWRLGGTALAQCYKQLGDSCPDLEDPQYFVRAFNTIQAAVKAGVLTAGHDVSDGGLVTCLLEMAFAGNSGLRVNIAAPQDVSALDVLFAEELGVVLEVSEENKDAVQLLFQDANVACQTIGYSEGCAAQAEVTISVNDTIAIEDLMVDLRDIWEETSFQLEKHQASPDCVEQERLALRSRTTPPYKVSFQWQALTDHNTSEKNIKVAVIREEGSNGDREMVSAFHMAGFQVWDINMQDLCSGKITLDEFQGLVFVGGFSYADVMGSAKGWAATLKFHSDVQAQFDAFFQRPNTFSLGVCNGCQLMALLGWVGGEQQASGVPSQGVHLTHNNSERFESRFSTVCIQPSPAIMLKGMEGSTLGIWVAHGEGRMVFKTPTVESSLLESNLAPIRYVDDTNTPTEDYPFNPNGSPAGLAALCSPDGRHLAMMPHPERCVLPWQWAWMPEDWSKEAKTSPWMKMFQNAYDWCCANQQ